MSAANNDGDRPLMVASKKGNLELVKLLIKAGANVNLSDNEGWTPLIAAAHKGHKDVCKALLDNGAMKSLTTAVRLSFPLATYVSTLLSSSPFPNPSRTIIGDCGSDVTIVDTNERGR